MTFLLPKTFGDKYILKKRLDAGSFGVVYYGTNEETGRDIAAKLESTGAEDLQLEHESRVYKNLAESGGAVPSVHWFGTDHGYNVMVMDLLGPTLYDLFNFCGQKYSLKTVLLLADQMISRIEYVHSNYYIHRAITPKNFVMGLAKEGHQVKLIDFGCAKRYCDPITLEHIPIRENENFWGNPKYCSINTHLKLEQSRRDDLESLGYVLVYLVKGSLPWRHKRGRSRKQEKKMNTSVESLCQGLPQEFAIFINYARKLRFEEKPDYSYLRKLFRDLSAREGIDYDNQYDWRIKLDGKKSGTKIILPISGNHQPVLLGAPTEGIVSMDVPTVSDKTPVEEAFLELKV